MENYNHNKEINWVLLTKYFAQEVDSDEAQEVEEWLEAKDSNKEVFLQLYASWQLSLDKNFDERAAWKKVQHRIQKKKAFILNPLIYKVAASLLLIAVSTFLINKWTKIETLSEEWVSVTSKGGLTVVTLEDGSVVHLNKNTTLKYPRHFDQEKREVHIDGEGFFEVSKRDSLPFVVSTNDLKIKVLGTSFNVDAYSGEKTSNVAVKSGLVSVAATTIESHSKALLMLRKDDMATLVFDKDSLFKTTLNHNNYLGWKTKVFDFDHTELKEVIKMLNKAYERPIILDNKGLNRCLLSAKFNNKSLEEVIDILVITYGLKVEVTSNGIRLYGNGCV